MVTLAGVREGPRAVSRAAGDCGSAAHSRPLFGTISCEQGLGQGVMRPV